MAEYKIKWKVEEPPTGRYRSFETRGWPSASYNDDQESPAARITCKDGYDPADIKAGKSFELTLLVADHSKFPWKWVSVKKRCSTVAECKELLKVVLKKFPHLKKI